MKHASITRLLGLMLALALLFGAAPAVKASTLTEKASVPTAQSLPQGMAEVGGESIQLNADASVVEETEANNTRYTADIVQPGSIVSGENSKSDPCDYFKFTLSKTSDIMFVSASTEPNMIFYLTNTDEDILAVSQYLGTTDSEGDILYVDAIAGTLEAGTYLLVVEQANVEGGQAAYTNSMVYAIELHLHSYTVTETVESTCVTAGHKTYTCSECGYYYEESLPTANHSYEAGTPVAPTCTEYGYTPYTCSVCNTSTQDDFVDPLGHEMDESTLVSDTEAKTHSYTCTRCNKTVSELCTFVQDPETGSYVCSVCGADAGSTVFRIYGENRIGTSMAIADTLKQELGVARFDTIIVASAMNFPDALTGSYLAAVKGAPILLTTEDYHADVISYITTNMSFDGTVYILGGESAVDSGFENWLTQMGITCKRLAGEDRLGTNLAILEEAGVAQGQDILICTATGFADSLSASASGLPMLLVHNTLTEEQKAFLTEAGGDMTIIGGTSAVSEALEEELSAYGTVERLAGGTRYETSVLVAAEYYPAPSQTVLAYAQNYPDGLCGGPLAYAMGAPLILTDGNCSWANHYMAWRDIEGGYVLGGEILISDNVVRSLFDMESNEPVPAM